MLSKETLWCQFIKNNSDAALFLALQSHEQTWTPLYTDGLAFIEAHDAL